jgi:metallo-beta-lactamase class B
VAGLAAFHQQGIPSYAHTATIALARSTNKTVPQNGFDQEREFKVGRKEVVTAYLGAGHTKDNVVGYFPGDQVLFGGCLIKELGAGKGNLEDANTAAWPSTVAEVKKAYPKAKIIIPGHGQPGGPNLLDYTIKLFEAQ